MAGEAALAADPKSYETMLLLSEIYSRSTRPTDLDMDDRLARSDKYAKDAMAEVTKAEKPKPDIADADWAGLKQGETQRAWVSLGLSAVLRKKYDEAKADFDKATACIPIHSSCCILSVPIPQPSNMMRPLRGSTRQRLTAPRSAEGHRRQRQDP